MVLIQNAVHPSSQSGFKIFHHPKGKLHAHKLSLTISPNPHPLAPHNHQPAFCPYGFTNSGYRWNSIICWSFCLASSTYHSVLKVHPHCSSYQCSISCSCLSSIHSLCFWEPCLHFTLVSHKSSILSLLGFAPYPNTRGGNVTRAGQFHLLGRHNIGSGMGEKLKLSLRLGPEFSLNLPGRLFYGVSG